jgi:methylmalonyl-CoA/ethylmalonyl-CoA epimerase
MAAAVWRFQPKGEHLMAAANGFGLSAIGQIAVNAHDINRAIDFYRDKLGMKFLFTAPPGLAFFDCDGIRLMLSLPAKPEFDHPSSIIYFNVDDIHLAYETLSGRGVAFEEQPAFVANMGTYDLWIAAFRDSENNLLAMMSNVAH